jgi:hypothetical protein
VCAGGQGTGAFYGVQVCLWRVCCLLDVQVQHVSPSMAQYNITQPAREQQDCCVLHPSHTHTFPAHTHLLSSLPAEQSCWMSLPCTGPWPLTALACSCSRTPGTQTTPTSWVTHPMCSTPSWPAARGTGEAWSRKYRCCAACAVYACASAPLLKYICISCSIQAAVSRDHCNA